MPRKNLTDLSLIRSQEGHKCRTTCLASLRMRMRMMKMKIENLANRNSLLKLKRNKRKFLGFKIKKSEVIKT